MKALVVALLSVLSWTVHADDFLSWTLPTTRVGGIALWAGEIQSVEIQSSPTASPLTSFTTLVTLPGAVSTHIVIRDPTIVSNVCYRVRVIDSGGVRGNFSAVRCKSTAPPAPSAPVLTIQ
jgi:hypothetical protein